MEYSRYFPLLGLCKSPNGKFVAPFSNIKPKHLIRLWPGQAQTRMLRPVSVESPPLAPEVETDYWEMYYNLYKYSRFYHNQTDRRQFLNGKVELNIDMSQIICHFYAVGQINQIIESKLSNTLMRQKLITTQCFFKF